jgi:hypothetical protein
MWSRAQSRMETVLNMYSAMDTFPCLGACIHMQIFTIMYLHYITFPGSRVSQNDCRISQNDCRMWNKSYKSYNLL